MFAPLIVKPEARTTVRPGNKSAHGHATADHDREIEREQTLERTPQPGPRFPNMESAVAWDFSKIPVSLAAAPHLPGPLQRGLNVGPIPEPLEYEADRVADQVMRMPDPRVSIGTAQPRISRTCDAPAQEEALQLRPAGQAVISDVPSSVHEVLRTPGEPLDPATRAFFEPRFGHDLSSVRLHSDEQAAQSADSIRARAYTAGHDIVFGQGRLAPTTEGRRLLAHELTHVVQQGGAARTVQRAPIAGPAAGATKPSATKGGSKAIASSFNSYIDLFNGFQDLAAAAINGHGAGLDSARFGGDLNASHRSLLWRVRTVLIQAQAQDKEQRLAAAQAWPGLAAKLQAEVTEATRLAFPGQVLAAVTDDIALLGRTYIHARAGKAEPELESFEDYADTVRGMNDLLWIFGRMGEAGEGVLREDVPNRKETVVSSAVLELNAKQRAALTKVEFGSRLNARHAKVLNTLRTALLLARSEAAGSASKALILWRSIDGDLRHVLARAPIYQVQFDVSGVQAEVDSAAQVLAKHEAAVHQENVGVALTKPRAPERVVAERAIAKAAPPVVVAGMKEARAVEDFQYALTIIEQHLTPSTDRPGEWILTSGDTVIRVRANQVQALRATVAKELKTYMAELVKAMVRVWLDYDSIQRGNSTFKLAVLGGWGGATDPGDQAHFKDSLIAVRDKTVYPLVDKGQYVEAFKWILSQKAIVDRQAKEVGDYDSDLDLGYSRLATAATVVQVALVALVPVAGEAALAGGAGFLAVSGTAVGAGAVGAGAGETGRQVLSGEELDPSKIGKKAYAGGVIGLGAVGPAATRGLGELIAPGAVGTTAVGANALAAGTIGAAQSKLGGGDALEGFAGGFLGSMAGSATSQALGPIAQNPVANTVIAGGIGAGTAALTGGDPLAGAAGGISGSLVKVPPTRSSPTPRRVDVAEGRVGGEVPNPTVAAHAEPTTPPVAEPVEPVQTPAQRPAPAGTETVPLRSSYTPTGEEPVAAGPSRARPFNAKDSKLRPGGRQPSRGRKTAGADAKVSGATRKVRTPDDEFADFQKMLTEEFGAKGSVTSDTLLRMFRYGSRDTVVKYLKRYLLNEAKKSKVLALGDFELELKPNVSVEKQVDEFLKRLEGAHSTPQAFGKKLPTDVKKALPGGEYDPNDALVIFTDKPTHTAMDQPWKDAFNNIRKSGDKEATGQKVFDEVADGIRKTPGMSEPEKRSRIARLHDEMFIELGLVPDTKYPVPRIIKWWEILAAKAKRKSGAP
jgi:Domain of unknown function (DUF4157)